MILFYAGCFFYHWRGILHTSWRISLSEKIVRIVVDEGISTQEHMDKLSKAESFIMSKRVSPKIKKSAVVGLSLASGIALKTLNLVTGCQIKAFPSEDDPAHWLRS